MLRMIILKLCKNIGETKLKISIIYEFDKNKIYYNKYDFFAINKSML